MNFYFKYIHFSFIDGKYWGVQIHLSTYCIYLFNIAYQPNQIKFSGNRLTKNLICPSKPSSMNPG